MGPATGDRSLSDGFHRPRRTPPLQAAREWFWRCALEIFSAWSHRPLVDPDGRADVSITSYGGRLASVHLTIESIGRGSVRPRRLTLYLDDEACVRRPPPALAQQVARGLRIAAVPDLGPHKKQQPAIQEGVPVLPLVTADDDVVYPRHWLRWLLEVHREHPQDIVAHRARRMQLDGTTILPYATWRLVRDDRADLRNVATGVGGVLLPVPALEALRAAGDGYLTAGCGRADDLWIHLTALRAGIPTRQARPTPLEPVAIPGLPAGSLSDENVAGGANDRAVATAYGPEDRRLLAASARRSRTEKPNARPTTR